MKNLFIVLAAVLGTSVMVSAQTTPTQAAPAKEVKATKHHHKNKGDKKAKSENSEAPKAETTKMK
ncbi:hypothetical protein [Flavobacterium chilense]|uniref:Pentapeptide MXKDX repeat protein n=1 Tax=Flavobacterium chilense TaxID=946677 RepID=A0A1M7LXQ9_9FLAO|nr:MULTISPECIES: hypothetical protein [Flavobacterium]SHM82596.1 hypothetical protein SAMN05444484_110107 [Flavobacterium chilense]